MGTIHFHEVGFEGKNVGHKGGGIPYKNKMESDGPKAIQKHGMAILPIQINL